MPRASPAPSAAVPPPPTASHSPPAPPLAAAATAWPAQFRVAERRLTLGRQYEVLAPDGRMLAYASQKWFRVKEAFEFHTDRSKSAIAFTVRATKVFDFKANLEVRDAAGTLLGTLRRKGWASILADHWQVVAPAGFVQGELREPRGRGVARRALSRLVPYRATVTHGNGAPLASVRGTFQFWGDTYDVALEGAGATATGTAAGTAAGTATATGASSGPAAGAPHIDPRVLAALVVVVDAMSAERGSLLDVTGLGS